MEHYYQRDVPKVLEGMIHVLKDEGFVHIRVPDLGEVMKTVVRRGLDFDDILYRASGGPITVREVLFGWDAEIDRGKDYYGHKTGFTVKSLSAVLKRPGFKCVYATHNDLEIVAYAFKNWPNELATSLLNLRLGDEAGSTS